MSMDQVYNLLINSKRPILLIGHGIELSKGGIKKLNDFFRLFYRIPVVFSQGGINVLPTSHPLNIGKIGIKGSRSGNFAIQNADLIISIGSRLSVASTGQDYPKFAREAKLIVVDINPLEHQKNTVKIDVFLQYDAALFLILLGVRIHDYPDISEWIKTCQRWKQKWQVFQPTVFPTDRVNLYEFINVLNKLIEPNDVIVADAGSAMFVTSQNIQTKEGNKIILSNSQAEMGFTLPACIGVATAKKGRVIGITGDGSLQMNIQELQTVKHHNLPLKLFVWNNNGYLTMRNTQKSYFGRYTAVDDKSGISFPDLMKISYAYGIEYMRIIDNEMLSSTIPLVLQGNWPTICEVMCLQEQDILTVKSIKKDDKFISRPLEDMYPYLDRKEFKSEMISKILDESE